MAETALAKREPMDHATLTAVVTDGDCSKLNDQQRREYYLARCEAAGLDPRTAPFMFTRLNNKLVLYALKSATDQLASNNKVVTTIIGRETVDGVYCVTVRATAADGRSTEDLGAVQIGSLKGEALANALMKAVTKAKRRAVLSLCGLGMLDETEVQDVTAARAVRGTVPDETPHDEVTGEVLETAPTEPTEEEKKHVAELIITCDKGFNAEPHKLNWLAKHRDEIGALKVKHPELYRVLKDAYDKAHVGKQPNGEEAAYAAQ